jgi:murein DD-endopeptidase MepM/ murein hydrolase activator NlpD
LRREIPQKVDSQISPTDPSRFQSAARFGASLFRRTRSASLLGVTLSAGALGAVVPQHKAQAYLIVEPTLLGTTSSLPGLVNSEDQQGSQNGISALLTSVSPQVANSMAPIKVNTWSDQETSAPTSEAVFSIAPKLIAGFQLTGQANLKPESALISGVSESALSSQQAPVNSASPNLLSDAVPQSSVAINVSTGRELTQADAISSAQELIPAVNALVSSDLKATLASPTTSQEVVAAAEGTVVKKPAAVFHTVQKDENLTEIAAKYQVSPESIVAANQIPDPNVIEVQSDLAIPVAQPLSEKTPLLLGTWVDNTKVVSKAISQMGVASALLAPQRWPSVELTSAQSVLPDPAQPGSQQQNFAETSRRADKIPQSYLSSAQPVSSASESLALNPRASGISTPYSGGFTSTPTLVARRSMFPQVPGLDLPSLSGAEKFLPSSMGGGSQQYAWPAKGALTSQYGWRWGRMHRGIDVAGPVGTPIVAAASGVVITAGWNSGGYGYVVEIQHPDGSFTRYAHNSVITTRVGSVVQQGEMIAEMGSTGRSTGPHCHFEIHPNGQGAVDPMAFLARS